NWLLSCILRIRVLAERVGPFLPSGFRCTRRQAWRGHGIVPGEHFSSQGDVLRQFRVRAKAWKPSASDGPSAESEIISMETTLGTWSVPAGHLHEPAMGSYRRLGSRPPVYRAATAIGFALFPHWYCLKRPMRRQCHPSISWWGECL